MFALSIASGQMYFCWYAEQHAVLGDCGYSPLVVYLEDYFTSFKVLFLKSFFFFPTFFWKREKHWVPPWCPLFYESMWFYVLFKEVFQQAICRHMMWYRGLRFHRGQEPPEGLSLHNTFWWFEHQPQLNWLGGTDLGREFWLTIQRIIKYYM